MKLIRLSAIFICLCFNVLHAHAQLTSENLQNVRVETLTDDDIKTYYQKVIASGLAVDQALKLAQERGMPAAEIEKLKLRIATISGPSKSGELGNRSVRLATPERSVNVDAALVPMSNYNIDSQIFGASLFSSASSVFEPNIRIATPTNYILGPDDELIISVFGYSEQTYNAKVNPEGNIYIPNVGPIFVSGLSIEDASSKIKGKLASTIYHAISSGQTKVQITLGNIKTIRVTVIGEAKKPATYSVSSLTTLFNVLYLCGGPTDMGTYRNIELIRGNKVVRKVDLYKFLAQGDQKDNAILQEQDIIRIPYYQVRVSLLGQVKRTGKYELQSNENFNNLLAFAGGFSDSAYRASVKINQITDKELKVTDLDADHFDIYLPKTSDQFTVGKILDRYTNRVQVLGAVLRPGNFEMTNGLDLKTLLEKAGGPRPDAFMGRGIISRKKDDLTPTIVSFNITNILNGTETIQLKKDDEVSISSMFDLKDKYSISIEGEVRKPGNYEWKENIGIQDLILQAGGFTEFGNKSWVQISRRITNANMAEIDHKEAEIIDVDLDGGKNQGGKFSEIKLEPYDIVMVRRSPGFVKQRQVYVKGEVMNPGSYTLGKSIERISNLVKSFGGFNGAADSSSITIRRPLTNSTLTNEERMELFKKLLVTDEDSLQNDARLKGIINKNYDIISIDLRTAIASPGSPNDLILEDGDMLTVNRASTLVKISGEVYYPTQIPFIAGQSLKYYIAQSGNYTANARKGSTMVIYPDGKAKTPNQFLFFKSYPPVTSRSEIFVPTKSNNNKHRLSTGEWVGISSIFATLGTLLITAFKK